MICLRQYADAKESPASGAELSEMVAAGRMPIGASR